MAAAFRFSHFLRYPCNNVTTHCKIMSRRGRIHIHIKSSRRSYILLRNITTVDHFDTLPIIYKCN